MGNATGLDLFEVQDEIDYNNERCCNWSLHNGIVKKEPNGPVSVFKLNKRSNADQVPLSTRNIQKLRTLRHPMVLAYIESGEMDDVNVIVTEACISLESWMKDRVGLLESSEDKEAIFSEIQQELIWGFRCVLLGLNFLHANGGLVHGNLGMNAVFVTPSGDWKIGSFEISSTLSSGEEQAFFIKNQQVLDTYYYSPERKVINLASLETKPTNLDIYSFGKCIEKCYEMLGQELPKSMTKYVSLMVHSDVKKRPSALKLTTCALFTTDHCKLLENIDELATKTSKDALEVIGTLEPSVSSISQTICSYKILPNINRIVQMALNDYPSRDSRESSRQSISLSVLLLSKMAGVNKVNEKVYEKETVPLMVQLWALADRQIRTVLLQSLGNLAPLTSVYHINRSIFDNLISGFSDSSPKLRETTLTSLMCVVKKLEDHQLNEKLVRCILSLQNDTESSIRTNATIFLGKIAPVMNEVSRHRNLCPAFTKAMKDPFLHCRIAGLRTSLNCCHLLEYSQISQKLMPQACMLLMDKNMELRHLSHQLLGACLDVFDKHHKVLYEKHSETKDKMRTAQLQSNLEKAAIAVTKTGNDGNSWTSYINEAVEKAVVGPDGPDAQTLAALHGSQSPATAGGAKGKPKFGQKKPVIKKLSTKDISVEDGGNWEGDGLDDLDLDDDDDNDNSIGKKKKIPGNGKVTKSPVVKKVEGKEGGKDKEDFFEDF